MVYRGKPSLDCLHCRRRKLRCDLQKDGCGQCRRAKLTCEGYRDPSQTVFRDETKSTRSKALIRAARRPYPPSIPSLQVAWDARARQAFFTHYVFGLSRSYDVLAPLYEREPSGGHLAASVDAVSLAFLSHQYNAPDFKLCILANERYLAAIRLINKVLHTPEEAAADATLQAVLLLDLYEKLVNRNPQSSSSWMSHINGALSLTEVRGKRNLSTYIGRRLGTRLAITLIISCAAANIRVPGTLDELRKSLSNYIGEDPKWSTTGLIVELANLNADMHNGRVTEAAEILAKVEDIDARFLALEKALPGSWQATRVLLDREDPFVFGAYYDLYKDHFVTQVRNVCRTARLSLNLMIQQRSGAGILARRAANTIAEISREICASVPQFVLPDARPDNKMPFTPLQTLQCYTVVTPLYVAGKFSGDAGIRDWVVGILNHIAHVGTVRKATEVSEILRTAPETSHWNIYAMLGSYAFAA